MASVPHELTGVLGHTQDAQDRVEYSVQLFADVVRQEAQEEVAILLQQLVLSTVLSAGDGIR